MSTDATRGPWFALAADYTGFILSADEMQDHPDLMHLNRPEIGRLP